MKNIEKVSISEDEANEYTTTANVTIEVDKAIPDYKDKEITFFI